jgi:glycosyltransferase involved in cell wall biosynthesis
MKVAIMLDVSNTSAGGSHTFNSMMMDQVVNYKSSNAIEIVTLWSGKSELGFKADISLPNSQKYRLEFYKTLISQLFYFLLKRKPIALQACRSAALNKLLKEHKIDFLLAIQPLGTPVDIPFITVSWDIAHRITPYFSEISGGGRVLTSRDAICESVFARAYLVVVGTERGKEEIQTAYGVNPERLKVVPFPVKEFKITSTIARDSLAFFYPANFWNHKNHILLLEAIKMAKEDSGLPVKLILTGSDKGNLEYLKEKILELELEENIQILGFVSRDEIEFIYSKVNAILFPSLIGPDNLPPLEALASGCRVAVSDIPGARDQLGNHVDYFAKNNPRELADLILKYISEPPNHYAGDPATQEWLSKFSPDKYLDKLLLEIANAPRAVQEIAAQNRT